METTRLDRWVDADAINRRRELLHAGRFPTLHAEAGNAWIGAAIAAGQPAAIGKLGEAECNILAAHLGLRQFYKYTWAAPTYSEAELGKIGVFPPTDEIYWRYSELILECLRSFDGCAVSGHNGETEIITRQCPQARRLAHRSLEPYFFAEPWSARLAGKRVLLIHPFGPSIRTQFARRTAIWPGQPQVLPAFEFELARSPYGFSRSGFNDWFAMLQWFETQIAGIHRRWPFDVALIGCGPAGVPLTAFVKKLGAVGIHLGDTLPTLFGIRGAPAGETAELRRFFNESWVHPQASELPAVFSP
jgi:hypothetical protein